jgi:hypothetical protein
MTDYHFTKLPNGDLRPFCDDAKAVVQRWKSGDVVRAEFAKMRNGQFFKKWWALVKVGFELWEESGRRGEYNGQEVLPVFEKYRKDITVLAGYYHPVINIRGAVRVEADSISFAKMSEENFERLYSATINAILKQGYNSHLDEKTLREWAESVIGFA